MINGFNLSRSNETAQFGATLNKTAPIGAVFLRCLELEPFLNGFNLSRFMINGSNLNHSNETTPFGAALNKMALIGAVFLRRLQFETF